jgi:predicted ATP-grasp superfamily ATP-dependent carboligase
MQVPSALERPAAFLDAVERLARDADAQVVLPISEAALLALVPARERLRPAVVPFPTAECVRRICDKSAVLAAAREVGICIPRQVRLDRPPAPGRSAVGDLAWPVVVKPSRSVTDSKGVRQKTGVRYARDLGQLGQILAGLDLTTYPILVQERIAGPGVGVFVLLWGGRLLGVCAHRRIREKPPSGGVSVLRESIPVPPGLLESSLALLRCLDWDGVAMVEYKLDGYGTPHLMEINGRFWGSLQLAIDAGVDFPRLLVSAALGRPEPPRLEYRVGVRSRWWWGDVDHLLLRLRRSRDHLSLPPDAPGRWRVLTDFLRSSRPRDRSEVLRWDDPRPFLRETLAWIQGQ